MSFKVRRFRYRYPDMSLAKTKAFKEGIIISLIIFAVCFSLAILIAFI
jgi:hypothetical protein